MRGRSDGPGIGLAAENGGNPGLAFLLMDVKIKTVMNLWKWIPVAVVSCCCSFDTGYGQDIAAPDMPDVDEYRKTPERSPGHSQASDHREIMLGDCGNGIGHAAEGLG